MHSTASSGFEETNRYRSLRPFPTRNLAVQDRRSMSLRNRFRSWRIRVAVRERRPSAFDPTHYLPASGRNGEVGVQNRVQYALTRPKSPMCTGRGRAQDQQHRLRPGHTGVPRRSPLRIRTTRNSPVSMTFRETAQTAIRSFAEAECEFRQVKASLHCGVIFFGRKWGGGSSQTRNEPKRLHSGVRATL